MKEQEQPLECLFRLMRALRRGQSHHHGPHHFHGYGRLMETIAGHEGASARELTELLDIRPSSLSEMLSRLETQGDIRRQRDEKDARISRVWLTEQGQRRIKEQKENRHPYQKALLNCLSEQETQQLNTICQKLIDCLEKEQKEECLCRKEAREECGGRTGF